MAQPVRPMHTATLLSVDEYLALDEAAPEGVRLEYWDGALYIQGQPYDPEWGWEAARAMAGASFGHVRTASRLMTQLNVKLGNGCEALTSDLRVRTQESKYVYPDVVVVCGEPELSDERPPSLLNPTVLVEIVSEHSRTRDYIEKLNAYMTIPGLLEYWIVEQESPRIVRYVRGTEGWVIHPLRGNLIASEHLGIEIPLSDIYST